MTPPFSRILILPRSALAALALPEPCAVVSIDGPRYGGTAEWFTASDGRLDLYFADVGKGNPGAMSQRQATRLACFVRAVAGEAEVRTLVVACNFGVSRSPSVAFAVADALNLGRAAIEWRARPGDVVHRDPPNSHVYGIVCAALED
jgi:predicted protein tyrosine phosphatase